MAALTYNYPTKTAILVAPNAGDFDQHWYPMCDPTGCVGTECVDGSEVVRRRKPLHTYFLADASKRELC